MNNRKAIAIEFARKINSDLIKEIILFGSVARGDDGEDSDIDILIVSNHQDSIENIITDAIAEIVIEEHELISAHVMSEERFNKTKDYSFLSNVLEEGVVIGWIRRVH